MNAELQSRDLENLRHTVRRHALANLILILLDEARRTNGRLSIHSLHQDALLLRYRDVRTLVRENQIFQFASRDFEIVLACPPPWPIDRSAPLVPWIIAPDDFRHSNSDGHGLCLDLQGVLPERIPALLYDNLRLRHFRLDHCVDFEAADFVRAHLEQFPADPRPLYPSVAADPGMDEANAPAR